jgi:uncharacterized RmlC-like cupin family protein
MLLFAQAHAQVPFDIRRLFALYALPEGARRGSHAHREQHQFLMMLAGRCRVIVDNGERRVPVLLETPAIALYAPPMLWLELDGFSSNAVCVVLTSGDYDEADYIRDRAEFEALVRG